VNAASVGPNEVLRFALEVAALVALGYAGWNLVEDPLGRVGLAILLPLFAAGIWGVFRVDGDPKVAPMPVPGIVRLSIEFDYFAAVVLLVVVGQVVGAVILGVLVLGHYAWGYRRVLWLLRHPGRVASMRGG